MAEKDRIAISRKACVYAGVRPINSLEDSSAEGVFCNEMYAEIVRGELSIYSWKFATKYEELNELAEIPEIGYNTAHQAPNDVIHVDTVFNNDKPIDYDLQRDKVYSNNNAGAVLIMKYRFRADETIWVPYFRLLVIHRLAAGLAFSIARRVEIADSMNQEAEKWFMRAKTKDTQSATNKKVNLSRLKVGRRGTLNKFWRDR